MQQESYCGPKSTISLLNVPCFLINLSSSTKDIKTFTTLVAAEIVMINQSITGTVFDFETLSQVGMQIMAFQICVVAEII